MANSGNIDLMVTILSILSSLKITVEFINYKHVFHIRMKLNDQEISSIQDIMVQMSHEFIC